MENLEKAINKHKQQSMKSNIINTHDIHHYAMLYIIVAIILGTALAAIIFKCRNKKQHSIAVTSVAMPQQPQPQQQLPLQQQQLRQQYPDQNNQTIEFNT